MSIETLTLYNSPFPKRRYGPNTDGGYVLVNLPGEYDYFISGGIGGNNDFEIDILNNFANLKCIAFDGTIGNIPSKHERLEFQQKNLGAINSNNLTNLVEEIKPFHNILLKIDIEGHEFNLLPGLISSVITKVKQLVIEIHSPGDIQKHPNYFKGLSHFDHNFMFGMLNELNKTHTLVHFHANNGCALHTYNSTVLPNVFECTYIRNDFILEKTPNNNPLPTSLDFPNVLSKPEYTINYPPFCN